MKKNLIAVAILAASTFASVVHAADGTLNFTGTVTDAACTVTPATADQIVELGTVSSSGLSTVGEGVSPTKFDIVLTACPAAAASAVVKFDGPADAGNSSLLALTDAADVAKGVAIGIYEENASTLIPIGSESSSKALSTTTDTTFKFIAKYVATTAAVVAGSANAVSDFTVVYN